MELGIKKIESFLPLLSRTSEDMARRFGFDLEFLEAKVGISSRPLCAPDQAVSELAIEAARKLFDDSELQAKDVELVVVCTQNPDYRIPHTAALVQDALGLPTTCASFDLNLACSGFVYGLSVCLSFMKANAFRHALFITAEAYSKIIHDGDRDTMALFGDGACAAWLGPQPICHPLGFTFGTDGAGYDKLIVREGGSRSPLSALWGTESILPEGFGRLEMDGRGIFDFAMRAVPVDAKRCLAQNGLTMDEIDYFVLHQASGYMLEWLAKRMGIPAHKQVVAIKDTGNTVSSSIPLALGGLMRTHDLRGKNVFICGFGGGLSWASTVLKFV